MDCRNHHICPRAGSQNERSSLLPWSDGCHHRCEWSRRIHSRCCPDLTDSSLIGNSIPDSCKELHHKGIRLGTGISVEMDSELAIRGRRHFSVEKVCIGFISGTFYHATTFPVESMVAVCPSSRSTLITDLRGCPLWSLSKQPYPIPRLQFAEISPIKLSSPSCSRQI